MFSLLPGRLLIYCWELERGQTCNYLISGTSLSVCLCGETLALEKGNVCYCDLIIRLQLSVYKGAKGIQALLKSNARKLAEQDESILVASGIPYTMTRAGLLQNSSGGTQGFSFEKVLFKFQIVLLFHQGAIEPLWFSFGSKNQKRKNSCRKYA